MSQLNWSKVFKLQDDYVHEQEKKENERKLRIKSIYKNELLKMINQHKSNVAEEKEQDRRAIESITFNQKKIQLLEEQEIQKKHQINEQIARENLMEFDKKRRSMDEENERNKRFYDYRYKKIMTEANEEAESKEKQRIEDRKTLALAYDNKLCEEKQRRTIEKMEDLKFAALRSQIELKKDESRKEYLNKLKNGYSQNPETYERSSHLIFERQKERMDFITKIAAQEKDFSEYRAKEEEIRVRKIRETSNFNRECFQNREKRFRNKSLNEINESKNNYRTMQSESSVEREAHSKEAHEKRRMLKSELEKQIIETNLKRSRINKMTDDETKMNKGNYVPALPGIWRDHRTEKQQRVIEAFLKNETLKEKELWY